MSEILQNLRTDLAEYLGYRLTQTMEVIGDQAKQQWDYECPETIYERNDFYMQTEHYLGECTDWHDRDEILRQWSATLINAAKSHDFGLWTNVMDYGSGIATHSLALAEANKTVNIMLADFDCPAMKFAKWKAEKYGLDIDAHIFDPLVAVQPIPRLFDCIICTDVIGHSTNPYKMLLEILTHTRYVFWNSDFRVFPNDRYPMHCTKPPVWDWLWDNTTINAAPFLYKSFLYRRTIQEVVDALDLPERLNWIDI